MEMKITKTINNADDFCGFSEGAYDEVHYNYEPAFYWDNEPQDPGAADYIDFMDAGISVKEKPYEREESLKLIQQYMEEDGLVPSFGSTWYPGKKFTKKQKEKFDEDLNKAIESAEEPKDYCYIMYYYAWYLIGERYYTFRQYYRELHQEMMTAVLACANGYDKTHRPSTYFEPRMIHAACQYINTYITFSTPHYAGVEKKMNELCRERSESPFAIPVQDYVDYLGLSESAVRKVLNMKRARRAANVERLIQDHTEYEYRPYQHVGGYWSDANFGEETLFANDILLNEYDKTLTDLERTVLVEYYGLDGNTPKKQTFLAKELGLKNSNEVRKIMNSGLRKLKAVLED